MIQINDKIEKIKFAVSNIEDDKNKEILDGILSVLDDMSNLIENINARQDYLEENIEYMDEDLTVLQDEVFEEVSIEDLMEIEDEYIEISCKNCNKPLFVEKESVENNKVIPCPFCKEKAN